MKYVFIDVLPQMNRLTSRLLATATYVFMISHRCTDLDRELNKNIFASVAN
ncbi:hypothetical protein [Nubsella zeaxanthinifaciens]|uniref:hypothetical protein n=1 Tax=Nubsella zeaxanthinifaciens TaxID=392412 RepID=UPI0013007701|nr:hypothetical protein [Nubsella zeaxanthinifaciens]